MPFLEQSHEREGQHAPLYFWKEQHSATIAASKQLHMLTKHSEQKHGALERSLGGVIVKGVRIYGIE
jgi:hypothetical protein